LALSIVLLLVVGGAIEILGTTAASTGPKGFVRTRPDDEVAPSELSRLFEPVEAEATAAAVTGIRMSGGEGGLECSTVSSRYIISGDSENGIPRIESG